MSGRWDGVSQEQLTRLYMAQVDKRLLEAEERMAGAALNRVLDSRGYHIDWQYVIEAGVYRAPNDDPLIVLAYEHWHRAHLAALGARVWEESNPVENRALMSDRAPTIGGPSPELQARLSSPDPRIRGTALGDIARGWA